MAKKNSKNNEFLNINREYSSTKVYELILELVNMDREDLAKLVTKIDYLMSYASNSIKHRDYEEARTSLNSAKDRMEILRKEGIDVSYLDYLYEGIDKKCKK